MNNRDIGKMAQVRFKALIRRKSTSARLRAILKETIDANKGRSRDAILAKFERRKKAYAKSLQRRAVASARASVLPKQRKRAQTELIEERLKLQEAKRLNVLAGAAQVNGSIKGVAKRNKVSPAQFLKNLERTGVSAATFKERIRTQISWVGVVRRQFGRQIAVSMADVDRHVASVGGSGAIVLKLQKVTLALPQSLGQAAMATRLREGEILQSKFSGCNSTKLLVRAVKDATFQDLGNVKSSTIAEPARSLLVQAKNGEMLPPLTKKEGVVLFAVCGRNAQTAQTMAKRELQQREFAIMGRRHLADLKRDAHIEYR